MKIKLWGTRGSIPTPSHQQFQTSRYGGDTTCVSVRSGNLLVILDAGSGLRLLGMELHALKEPVEAVFFFSHVHWDHIQGFPFFLPGFDPKNHFRLFGPRLDSNDSFIGSVLERTLRAQQENINFPIRLREMGSTMEFQDMKPHSEIILNDGQRELVVRSHPLNHPGGCFGYRIEERISGQRSAVFGFASDTEHFDEPNPEVLSLAEGADLLLHDAQYTHFIYNGGNGQNSRRGWGHSTWEAALRDCRAAGARHLLLHHHDPLHDDDRIAQIEADAQRAAQGSGIKVEAATQFRQHIIGTA